MKVLVADDDAVTRGLVSRTLEKFGYEVQVACDGAEAWQVFQANPFPLVITDWEMPELDGIQLCRKIRQADLSAYTYVIFLTIRHEKKHLIECLSAGADEFVSKPFHPQELKIRLRAAERILELESTLRDAILELRRMNSRLLKTSRLDPLMEIGNRLAFEEKMAEFHQQAVDSRQPYAMIMCDVDHFKSYNDSFGHLHGDEVLRRVAEAIRRSLRSDDTAFRYGGEEILVLLIGLDLPEAVKAAERVRKSVEQSRFQSAEPGRTLHVTVSCGVSCYPIGDSPETDWRQMVQHADGALYQAKAAGRNCVFAARPDSGAVRFESSDKILAEENQTRGDRTAPSGLVLKKPSY